MKFVSYPQLDKLARNVALKIEEQYPDQDVKAFAIPKGGISAALAIKAHTEIVLVESPSFADIFIDDLIDSGSTSEHWCDEYPGVPFYTLIDKRSDEAYKGQWVVFPWEGDVQEQNPETIQDNIRRILQFIGENPGREGLIETPSRVAKAMQHWFSGYNQDPQAVLKVFKDGGETYDQMITVKDIPFYSMCEHHMAPFFGTATVSYIPRGKIVGLSKISRLVDIYARRLQVQERMTEQIADALHFQLRAYGVGVMLQARHLCMESRGVCQQGHTTVTTALRGFLKDEPSAKAEFMRICTIK